MHAVGEERARAEEAGAREALRHRDPVSRPAVLDVRAVLRYVDVHARPRLAHGLREAGQRLVAEREARVGADDSVREGALLVRVEGDVLGHAPVAPLRPVAVGDLVAEHRPQAHRLRRVLDRAQGILDPRGRRVVVDEDGGAGERGIHGPHERGHVDGVPVERAVEPPPDALQDLHEAPGRRGGPRHSAGQRAIEVGVRVHEAGHHDGLRDVDDLLVAVGGQRAAALDDPVLLDPQVRGLDVRRIERDEGGALQEHRREGLTPAARGGARPARDRRGEGPRARPRLGWPSARP